MNNPEPTGTPPQSDPERILKELRRQNRDVLGASPEVLLERIKKIQQEKGPQTRAFSYQRDTIDEEARTVEVAFSSETPYLRWFGHEILGHDEGEIDLSRMDESVGAPVLVGHHWGGWESPTDDQVGVVEKVWIKDGVARALLRFGQSARAKEIFQDVVDGIRRQVSVGYFVNEMVLTKETEDGQPNEYRATDWTPYEISIVPVAADFDLVGVGKSAAASTSPAPSTPPIQEERTVDDDIEVTGISEDEARQREEAAADAAAKSNQERIDELLAVGKQYGEIELAMEFVKDGKSVNDLNKAILEKRAGSGFSVTDAPDSARIGMSDQEARSFSFLRLWDALAHPGDAGARERAAYEIECCEAAEQHLKKTARGTIIPYDVLTVRRSIGDFGSRRKFNEQVAFARNLMGFAGGRRDYNVGTAGDGGNLVATELLLGSFIDRLENALALAKCGITVLPGLVGNIAVPRQNGGASHYWLNENEESTESSATFDQLGMTPKTISAYSELSRRVLKQTAWAMEVFAQQELILRLALGIDWAGINGQGPGQKQPLGVLNTVGVGAVVTGGTVAWDPIVDLETEVGDSNAAMGNLCYLTNWRTRGALKKAKVDVGSGEFIWSRNATDSPVNGYRCEVSNQVPKDLGGGNDRSALIFGNWSDLVMGMWGGLDVQANPFSLDTKAAVRITAFQDVDMMIRHPESFSAAVDITA